MNLKKKIVTWALVGMMLFGVTTLQANALFSAEKYHDYTDMNYTEAVTVVTAYHIFQGDTTGSEANGSLQFRPQDKLTRAEAAKLAANISLGASKAATLGTATTSFTDLNGYEWASGYIKFCVENGIINGAGDGKFLPNGSLTHYEMLKLMVCALGYGSNGECTGTGWKLAVAAFSKSSNITQGLQVPKNFDYNKEVTREEAALYLFNALHAYKVGYSKLFNQYYPQTAAGELVISGISDGIPATLLESIGGKYVFGTIVYDTKYGISVSPITSNANKKGNEKVPINISYMDIGRSVYVYTDANYNAVTPVVFTDEIIGENYGQTSLANLSNPSHPDYLGDFIDPDAAGDTFVLIKNGVTSTATRAEVDACVAANGNVFRAIDSDGDGFIDKAICYTPKVARVSEMFSTDGGKVYLPGVLPEEGAAIEHTSGYRGLEIGQTVLVYTLEIPGGRATYIEKARTVKGNKEKTLSQNNGIYIEVDGVLYTNSGLKPTESAKDEYVPNGLHLQTEWFEVEDGEVILSLDAGGYIIHAEAVEKVLEA